MIAGMSELRTSMKRLVGEEGSGGVIESMQIQIHDLQRSRDRDRGFAAAISMLCGGTGILIGKLFGR